MSRLLEQLGITEDSRYATCFREAMTALTLFVVGAAASLIVIYLATVGKTPQEYSTVLGLPAYLFWGIVVVDLVFLLAVMLIVRFVYRDMPLDAADPSDRKD